MLFDDDYFKRMEKQQAKRKDEFNKLLVDQCCIIPEVGDTVVVAAGILGMGFAWIRKEAKVLAVGQNSYKVQFVDEKDILTHKPTVMWIHPALVTDVIQFQDNKEDQTNNEGEAK
jgi:hypothetical protein